jgi:cytochrome c-type biogenesis protein CcmH/NrfG
MSKQSQSLGEGQPPPSGVLEDDPDFEQNDDIVSRRRRVSKPATGEESATQDDGRFSVRATPVNALLLLFALVVGIVLGVWIAGKFTGDESAAPTPTPSQVAPAIEDTAAQVQELETVLRTDPDNVNALLDLGVLLFNQGDLDGAFARWNHATEVEPDNAYAWYFLAYYYRALPDSSGMDQAIDALNRVIELDPESEIATNAKTHLSAWTQPQTPSVMPVDPAAEPS